MMKAEPVFLVVTVKHKYRIDSCVCFTDNLYLCYKNRNEIYILDVAKL